MLAKKIAYLFAALILTASVSLVMTSCKKSFEEPPVSGPANMVANTTIKDLKARYTTQGSPIAITDDVVIGGVINADDKSGNYYQQFSLQDETGGILIRVSGSNLFTSYPVGRKVYIKCKGLFMGDYGRMIQLGGGIDSSSTPFNVTLLAANLQDEHIVKGELNQPLVPKTVTVSQLGTSLQDPYVNTLVKLENFEFSTSDLSKTYADPTASGNRTVQGCSSTSTNKLTLRSSNYSTYGNIKVAQGNGTLTGVYTVFNNTKQFAIRDTNDVQFTGPRCSGSSGGGALTTFTLSGSSPFVFNFDNIGSSLPTGVSVATGATATALGTAASFTNTNTSLWRHTGAGFKNFASGTGLTSSADSTTQANATNRALGVRQTSSLGDPGAAFVFGLNNTTGKTNLKLDFLLQSLDASATGRTATWRVEYGLGDTPTSFTTIASNPTPLTTTLGTFASTPVTVNFGSALNNLSQKVWIRIVTISGTSGSSSRPTTAIDDVKFSWN